MPDLAWLMIAVSRLQVLPSHIPQPLQFSEWELSLLDDADAQANARR